MDEQRHGTFSVISDQAQIRAVRFHRPGQHLGKAVPGGKSHRILDARIVPDFHPRITPPVKTMTYIAAIVQRNALLEHGRLWPQH